MSIPHKTQETKKGSQPSKQSQQQNKTFQMEQETLSMLLQRAEMAPHSITPVDADRLQRTVGNQAVGRLRGDAVSPDPSTIRESSLQAITTRTTSVQRQVDADNAHIQRQVEPKNKSEVTPEQNEEIKQLQVDLTLEDCRAFLKNADEEKSAISLNKFLAKAVGHNVYKREDDETERLMQGFTLSELRKPSRENCIIMMSALLTTERIDLREWGSLSPVTGYLLSQFVGTYYIPAIERITKMARDGEWEKHQIKPGPIGEFIDEAGAVEEDFHDLYEPEIHLIDDHRSDPEYHRLERDRTNEIGTTKGDTYQPGVKETLMAQGLASCMANVLTAIGHVLEHGGTTGGWTEYRDRISMHAMVFKGIVKETKRVEEVRAATISTAISLAFAILGPFASNIVLFGKKVQSSATEELRETLIEAGAKSAALDLVKDYAQKQTVAWAQKLAGMSSEELKEGMKNSLLAQIRDYEAELREDMEDKDPRWDAVNNAIDQLLSAFDYSL